MSPSTEIREARANETDTMRRLFRAYADWIGVDLGFQSFEAELAGLPAPYVRPSGCVLFAELDGQVDGCVALKRLGPGIGEVKRLYVFDTARGRGVGRRLMERLLAEAEAIGYHTLRLDTLAHMTAARQLYLRLGFVSRPPYYHNPLPGAVFMERALGRH